jgi:hypothetical protein
MLLPACRGSRTSIRFLGWTEGEQLACTGVPARRDEISRRCRTATGKHGVDGLTRDARLVFSEALMKFHRRRSELALFFKTKAKTKKAPLPVWISS